MKELVLALSVTLILLFGCTAPGGSGQADGVQNQQQTIPAPPESGNGNTQPAPQPAQNPPAQNSGNNDGSSVSEEKTQYVAFTTITQYDLQTRKNFADVVEQAYAFDVGIAELTDAGFAPLKNHEKAVVQITGPSGRFFLVPGPISEADYKALPASGFWPMPDANDPTQSQFVYTSRMPTSITGDENDLLFGGDYNIAIDIDGDHKAEGESAFTVPSVHVGSPKFGGRVDNNYWISWLNNGDSSKMRYTISVGRGIAGTTMVSGEPIPLPTSIYVEQGDSGSNILNLQAEASYTDKAFEDYSMGKPSGKLVFFPISVREVHVVMFDVGDFCHCDDAFRTKDCTVDEILADTLC